MHTPLCSSDGKYILDVYTAAAIPKNTYVYATDGSIHRQILKAENTLSDYNRPEIKNITLTANDGITPLYGKLILPVNFDRNKKYPTIVYLYNGPNVQLLHNSFPESGNLWYEYMAQRGYVVFTMDGRGSWNRGRKFGLVNKQPHFSPYPLSLVGFLPVSIWLSFTLAFKEFQAQLLNRHD
jgi:dipeptidyl-peptidase-4